MITPDDVASAIFHCLDDLLSIQDTTYDSILESIAEGGENRLEIKTVLKKKLQFSFYMELGIEVYFYLKDKRDWNLEVIDYNHIETYIWNKWKFPIKLRNEPENFVLSIGNNRFESNEL